MRGLAFGSGIALLVASSAAIAAPCAGFVDVDDADVAACAAVTFLKNRAITLGCTDSTHFCPVNNVTRLQMALFMQRLANNAVHQQGGNAYNATAVLGTLDNNPVEVYVNQARVARYEPDAAAPNVVQGSVANTTMANVSGAAVGGGGAPGGSVNVSFGNIVCDPFGGVAQTCSNRVLDAWGTVAGGVGNVAGNGTGASNDAPFAAVGGGRANAATGTYSVVTGGERNLASGYHAAVTGGNNNMATNTNSASLAGGGNLVGGQYATAVGGFGNLANGDYSFAAGRRAKTGSNTHAGAFVWADSTNLDFTTTAANEFAARATGGVRFVTAVDGGGATTAFMRVDTSGNLFTSGSVNPPSDRNVKEAYAPVDPQAVLERLASMPVTTWSYKGQAQHRHIGPTAQDFSAAFGVGVDDRHISTVDADGVAFVAIQALLAKVRAQEARIEQLSHEVARLQTTSR